MKRETLIAILTALTAGAVGGAATTVAITRKMLTDKEIGRYAKIIQLQQKLYTTNKREKTKLNALMDREKAKNPKFFNSRAVLDARKVATGKITVLADDVLRFAMANFSGPQDDEAQYYVGDFFAGCISYDTMTIDGLKKILDEVIPIAIAKHMLGREKVMLDTSHSVEFDEFVRRYKDIILNPKRRPNPLEERVKLYPEWAEANGYGPGGRYRYELRRFA